MSDYNSSLPVRTENAGDVIVRLGDATVPSQQLAVDSSGRITVKLTDGAGTAITSQANGGQQALDVGINVAGVQVDPRAIRALTSADTVTVVATDLDIRDLSHTQDSVKVGDGTDFLAINADGSLNITDNGGSLTVDATDLDIRDLAFATDKVDASGSAVTVSNTVAVSATDLDIRDLTAASDSVSAWIKDATGTAFSATNPLPVSITADNAGTEVNNYNTASAVAAGATSNHDYTVTAGKTLLLTQIEASGSGKMKIEVQVESGVASGTFASKFVQFNSTATPNMHIELKSPISVAAGVRVRVIRTNRDNQAQDVYSTISGQEV